MGIASQDLPSETADAIGRVLRTDVEIPGIREEMAILGADFSTWFKVELFDVLTDEQWNKFQNLVDNPPEYIKAWLRVYSSRSKPQEAWQPGLNSWQPGDPIPEQYRQERNTRGNFPRSQ